MENGKQRKEISFVASEDDGKISVFVVDAENEEDAKKLTSNVVSFFKHAFGDEPESDLVHSLFYIDSVRNELEGLLTEVFLRGRDYGIKQAKKNLSANLLKTFMYVLEEKAKKNLAEEDEKKENSI